MSTNTQPAMSCAQRTRLELVLKLMLRGEPREVRAAAIEHRRMRKQRSKNRQPHRQACWATIKARRGEGQP
jgi:hypothetical protein